jgi:subtilase family serine protease
MFSGRAVVVLLVLHTIVVLGHYPLSDWHQLDRALPQQSFSFTLALKLENLDFLKELHYQLTTPGSPQYRQWKSVHELNAITQPNSQRVKQLVNWLLQNKLSPEDFGDFIKVSGMVQDVEQAFYVQIYDFQHKVHPQRIIQRATTAPTLPIEFSNIVEFHLGISNFPLESKNAKSLKPERDVGMYYMIPRTLQEQYGVPYNYVATNPKSSQAIVGYGGNDGVSTEDLQVSISNNLPVHFT